MIKIGWSNATLHQTLHDVFRPFRAPRCHATYMVASQGMYAVMLGDATLANGVEGRHSLYEKARSDKAGLRSRGTRASTTYIPSQILENWIASRLYSPDSEYHAHQYIQSVR